MTLFVGTFTPYDFTREKALSYFKERAMGIRRSLVIVEKDSEHLTIRCPLSGDYVDVVSNQSDLEWLERNLRVNDLI